VWKAGLLTQAGEKVDPRQLWNNNQAWWEDFWNRGYVIINPDKDSCDNGWRVGRNYNLFRYHIGGNFYSKFPTKFNGGNLTFDPGHVIKEYPYDPDYRRWGGWSYTSANQTLLYWSFLKNGDFEGMIPEFDVYRNGLVNAEARTKAHFGHDGCSFAEQLQLSGMPVVAMYGFVEHGYSWRGGRPKDFEKGELFNPAISTFYQGQLEHAFMILEYHRFSGRDISVYMPFILSCVKFYDQHYQMKHRRNTGYLQQPLDDQGKLVIFPSTPGEGILNSTNPADAISGLQAITRALLDLPGPELSAEQRNYIAGFKNRIPALPVSRKMVDGKERTFLNISLNNEDQSYGVYPNLQSVWPYNLFYSGSQDFDRAFDTWKYKVSQEAKQKWDAISRGVIFSARMGLTDEAKFTISRKMDDRSGNNSRFPTFVGPGVDWSPDHNWLGCGMIGLQEMLIQTPGREIRLLPAWPKDWDVAFKLHAPYDTTIEGIFENGKIKSLKVTPEARERDVIYPSPR
jgi:hypothetical protein